jgi:hypothetical protein
MGEPLFCIHWLRCLLCSRKLWRHIFDFRLLCNWPLSSMWFLPANNLISSLDGGKSMMIQDQVNRRSKSRSRIRSCHHVTYFLFQNFSFNSPLFEVDNILSHLQVKKNWNSKRPELNVYTDSVYITMGTSPQDVFHRNCVASHLSQQSGGGIC